MASPFAGARLLPSFSTWHALWVGNFFFKSVDPEAHAHDGLAGSAPNFLAMHIGIDGTQPLHGVRFQANCKSGASPLRERRILRKSLEPPQYATLGPGVVFQGAQHREEPAH